MHMRWRAEREAFRRSSKGHFSGRDTFAVNYESFCLGTLQVTSRPVNGSGSTQRPSGVREETATVAGAVSEAVSERWPSGVRAAGDRGSREQLNDDIHDIRPRQREPT
ncbi:hypothetical protein GCM10010112_92840 [Actinoplanes lobatus]|uniref:Uncharacterized protein n=1 Tax=Actinoplanes lobatus TaxID=113568 RepID=A0ABQ4AZ87_9ACTN|nr:hypothetical protein GCM10010112_92840 [Actinoplanes lobatus]GIE46318.1 hypothetical protein Alo02nite_92160 [Actinoplanes lobatus]